MSERPAAAEQAEHAAMREDICAECASGRAELDGLVRADHVPDGEQRRAELLHWVVEHLADCIPHDLVVEICLQIERDEAAAGFPDFRVDDLPSEDLREEVMVFMAEAQAGARNQNATGQITDGVPSRVPAQVGQESTLLIEEDELEVEQGSLLTLNAQARATERQRLEETSETEGRTAELRYLQQAFNQLRADGIGTADALRQVVAQAENLATRQHLNTLLSRMALLRTALPDKPEVVEHLLNTAGLNLAATTVVGSFAEFMTAAEADPNLTNADRATLRQVIQNEERYARTGSHVQAELGQTILDENGQTVPAHSEDNPYQFRDHVAGFTETDGTQNLRATTTHGERVTLDITGWSGADIGRASELLQLWAMTENEGQTGYLTSLTKLNWTDAARIDPLSLRQSTQIVSALLGHGEGHDGDIFDGRDAIGVIRWQAQLANQTGASLRGGRDELRTHDALLGLGIRDEDGNLDLDVLRAFGDYSRDHWYTAPDYEAVQTHLGDLFPNTLSTSS